MMQPGKRQREGKEGRRLERCSERKRVMKVEGKRERWGERVVESHRDREKYSC